MLRKFESQSNVMAYYLNSLNPASDGKVGFSESYEDVLLQVSYFCPRQKFSHRPTMFARSIYVKTSSL